MTIQYSYMRIDRENECFFVLNQRRGSFIPCVPIKVIAKDLYIGGNAKRKDLGKFMLSSFELYFKNAPTESYLLPKEIVELIEDDMLERVGDTSGLV